MKYLALVIVAAVLGARASATPEAEAASPIPIIAAADIYAIAAGRDPPSLCGNLPKGSVGENCGFGLWIVRFSLPWDTLKSQPKAAQVMHEAATGKLANVAGVAEIVLDADTITLADMYGLYQLPTTMLFSRAAARPSVPKGSQVSDRPMNWRKVFTDKDVATVDAFVAAAFSMLPANYADPMTYVLRPSAPVVANLVDFTELLKNTSRADLTAAAVTVFAFNGFQHRSALSQLAAITSAASFVGRRGPQVIIVDTSAGKQDGEFAALHPKTDGGVVVAQVSIGDSGSASGKGGKFGYRGAPSVNRVKTEILAPRNIIIDGEISNPAVLRAAVLGSDKNSKRHVYSSQDQSDWLSSAVQRGQSGINHFFKGKPSYLRKLHSLEQFHRDVLEMRSGVAVIFLMRESEKFFSGQVKIAREVARLAAMSTEAVVNDKKANVNFDVLMADAEVHPALAKAFKAKQVPSVVFIVTLQNGQKGIRHFKGEMNNAKAIDKFMREQLFDGRDMLVLDENEVVFNEKAPEHNDKALGDDMSLRTYAWTLNPRRFTPSDASNALSAPVLATVTEGLSPEKKSTATADPAKMTAAQKKKAAKDAEELEKLRADLERKKKEKEDRIRKKAEEQKAADEKQREANAKAAEERKKAAQEAAAKEPKVPKVKAKPAPRKPADASAKPKAPKPPKDVNAVRKMWEKDAKEGTKAFMVKHDDGRIEILDKIV